MSTDHTEAFYDEVALWRDDSALAAPDLISRIGEQRLRWLLAILTLGSGLGIGAILASGAGVQGLIWLALAVVGIVGIVALTTYLEAGLTLFLAVGWFLFKTPGLAQGQGGGGEQGLALSQAGLLVLLTAWFLRRLLKREKQRLYNPLQGPIFAYLFLCVWSTAHSLLFPDAGIAQGVIFPTPVQVNVMEVVLRLLALGSVFLVASTVTQRGKARAAAAFLVAGVALFLVSLTGLARFLPGQGYGVFPQMLSAGALAALALSGVGKRWARAGALGLALLIFGWAFLKHAEWVSGWLAGGVALAIVCFSLQRRLFWAALGILAVVVIVRMDYFYDRFYVRNFYQGNQMRWGSARLQRWAYVNDREKRGESEIGALMNDRSRMLYAGVLYAEAFPLGIGLGNYKNANLYYGSEEVWNTTMFTSAHGTYAQTLSELGWLGLLTLFWLQIATLRMLYRYWKAHPPGWERAWILATYAGVWGVFVSAFLGDYLFPAYHNGGMSSFGGTIYTWLMVGFAIALARRQRTRPAVQPSPSPLWQRPLGAS